MWFFSGSNHALFPPLGEILARLLAGRRGWWALLLAATVLFISLFHVFFQLADRVPFITSDDALANLAVTLSRDGRYGLLAHPLLPEWQLPRNHGLLLHGPWGFYLAALLDWLLGTGYQVVRAIHPLGLVLMGVAGAWGFRRHTPAMAGVVILGLTWLFWWRQSPLFQPALAGTVLLAMGLAASQAALHHGHWLAWLAMGLASGAAATSHPIHAGLALWGVGLWWAGRRLPLARPWLALAALLLGLGVSGGIALWTLDHRLAQLWLLLADSWQAGLMADPHTLLERSRQAWGALHLPVLAFHLVLLTWAGTLLAGFPRPCPWRRQALILLAPPALAGLIAHLNLGLFPNLPVGFPLQSHLLTLWGVAALGGVVWQILAHRESTIPLLPRIGGISTGVVLLALLASAWALPHIPPAWGRAAPGAVPFQDYLERATEGMAEGARVWGDPVMGLDSGGRLELVSLTGALQMAGALLPGERRELAPDHLLVSGYRQQEMLLEVLRVMAQEGSAPAATHGGDTLAGALEETAEGGLSWDRLARLFPDIPYSLERVVHAPPYGNLLLYRRGEPGDGEAWPEVRYGNGWERRWNSALDEADRTPFEPAPPVTMSLEQQGERLAGEARATLRAVLPAGAWMLEVTLSGDHATAGGVVTATARRHIRQSTSGLGLPFAITPVERGERRLFLLYAHAGGPLHVSLWHVLGMTLQGVVARPVVEEPLRGLVVLPELRGGWRPIWGNQTPLETDGDGFTRASGAGAGEVIILHSAPQVVPRYARLVLDLAPLGRSQRALVGIRTGSGRGWLARPVAGVPLVFNSGNNDAVVVEIVDMPPPEGVTGGGLVVPPGRWWVDRRERGGRYVDRLMTCYDPRAPAEHRQAWCQQPLPHPGGVAGEETAGGGPAPGGA